MNITTRSLAAAAMLSAAAFLTPASGAQTVTLNIDAGNRGAKIGNLHYGIFFEEINHAGDGGLYAELVRNRSFEDNGSAPDYWSKIGNAELKLTGANMLNDAQLRALAVTFSAAGDGLANSGYWGINAVAGRKYDLSMWARGPFKGNLTASLRSASGASLGSVDIPVDLGEGWQQITASLTATANDPKASLAITADRAGSVVLDVVSLFPPTYKGRANGMRPDLAEKLEAMHPRFMRFPGGCYVEGQNSATGPNRFEWKKTIGPIETRPGHWNQNWGYRSTDGLGFHEYLQLAEDLGATPLWVCNIGLGHDWLVDYLDIDEFIQEALDAIEYCNGDASTKWGAVRAANGHPEPFGLYLLEVGNENYQNDHYAERYKQFYDVLRERHPEITIIGNVEAWGTDYPSWRPSTPTDVVDEHYYRSPSWFVNCYNKYDSYDRSTPKVYVGEYAVTQDFGTNGHLTAALGEAVYMLGMENNSDMCVMNSYAPIFINENDKCWQPDMIRFNSEKSYGTPSYHVQNLMSNLVGKQNVKWTENGNLVSGGHKIGLSSWSTNVSYDNVKVSAPDGTVLFSDDFSAGASQWNPTGGKWNTDGGSYNQTDASMTGAVNFCSVDFPEAYTLELDARKNSGNEGFLVVFNYGDKENYCWWNIAGWANAQHAIQVVSRGTAINYDTKAGSIATGQTYHLKLIVDGTHVMCYIDDKLVHNFTAPISRRIYAANSVDEDAGLMYVKVVNPSDEPSEVVLDIANADVEGVLDYTLLTSAGGRDENTADNPDNVVPSEGSATVVGPHKVTFTAGAYSLSIIRLKVKNLATGAAPGAKPSAEAEAEVREALDPLARKLANLHATTQLPVTTRSGATVEWNLRDASPLLSVSSTKWASTLSVASPLANTSPVKAGTLVATVHYPAGQVADMEFPVTIAPTDGMYGYLYCYMKRSKEITNFALGTREDMGMSFHQLLNGAEVFNTAELATVEGGTRDSYIARGHRADEYFMTTTDMCNAKSGMWNNFGLDLLRSHDLIHWESSVFDFRKGKKIFSDPQATVEEFPTDADYANITRVWAPQFIWSDELGAYVVYYSLLAADNPRNRYDMIFYSLADKDFKTLTQPRLLYDAGYSVIDADIELNPYDGLYHMYLKHEGAPGILAGIHELTSDKLIGGEWTQVLHVDNEGQAAVEGSSAIRRIDEDIYNLYYMRYSDGVDYKVCQVDHLGLNPSTSAVVTGDGHNDFQHGSFMTVTETEYNVLQGWSDLVALMAQVKELDTDVFDQALTHAEAALACRSIESLAEAIPAAIDEIRLTKEEYVKQLIDGRDEADLTELLVNPDFSNNTAEGWCGTVPTAGSTIGELWNLTYDTYQVLESMPAGTYTFSCQGFYRYGWRDAWMAVEDGSERLLARLYANGAEVPLMSLYDKSAQNYYRTNPYTYPDNMGQAYTAFNVYKLYNNSVSICLPERADLRLGIRKNELITYDWTAFDNFRLTYSSKIEGVEDAAVVPADEPVDIYNAAGILVRRNTTVEDAASTLPAGIYLTRYGKFAVK